MRLSPVKLFVTGAAAAAVIFTAVAVLRPMEALARSDIVVYKTATCGCCHKWVEHLEENGFNVTAHDVTNLGAIKTQMGITNDLASCHTAVLGRYVIEGHVPAEVIDRLMNEQPAIAGLAVPGMPTGSPGMEGPNARPYDVVAFTATGGRDVFVTVTPRSQ
jgi:hypothetical protein